MMGFWQALTKNWKQETLQTTRKWRKKRKKRKLHRLAKVDDFLEMWQGSQNLRDTHKESRAQNKKMTAVGYTLDTEEILIASWSLFQHDCAAAFKLSERSPLPPPLSAKDLPGGRTQVLNVHRIRTINRDPVESAEDSVHESILDTQDWLHQNGDLDNPNDSEDDCAVDVASDMEQDNTIEDQGYPVQRDVSATPDVPRLIPPTQTSKGQAEMVLMSVNAIETRRHKGLKKK